MDEAMRPQIEAYYEYWYGLNAVYAEWARAHGLSVHTLFVVEVLRREGAGCHLGRICERLQLPKQTVHSVLEGLSRAGYLVRQAAADDRRKKLLSLTPAGCAYADAHLSTLYDWEQRAFSRLTADERTAMTALNARFVRCLREEAAR